MILLLLDLLIVGCHPFIVVQINSDYSFNNLQGKATSGVVIRDREGFLLGVCHRTTHRVQSALAIKALAALHGLPLALNLGFDSVILKGDAQAIIAKFETQTSYEISHIISDANKLSDRWHHKKEKKALEHKVTVEVRMLIDMCCESQFIWRPYLDEDLFVLIPERAYEDAENWCSVMPLIYFALVEMFYGDRNSRPILTTQAEREAWFLIFPNSGLRRGSSGSGSSSSAVGGSSRRRGRGAGGRGRRVRRAAAEPEPKYPSQVEEVDVQFDTGSYPLSEPQFFDPQPVVVDYMTSVIGTTSLSSPLVSTGVGGAGPSMFRTPRRMNVESEEDSDDENSGQVKSGEELPTTTMEKRELKHEFEIHHDVMMIPVLCADKH
ncbi:hypothetical protein GQ457_04G015600 [Hibiscus cannabinus]